jgi:hypothetical protein
MSETPLGVRQFGMVCLWDKCVTLEHLAARKLELAEPFHPATIGRPPDTRFLASASKIHQRSRVSASVSTTEGRRWSQLNGWSWPGAVMTTSPPLVPAVMPREMAGWQARRSPPRR